LARGVLEYRLAAGARRFEMGHYNLPAVCALGAALDLILGVGVPLIERHVLALSARLTDGLLDLGYRLVSPRDRDRMSHIVLFREPPGSGLSLEEISRELDREKIRHSVRLGAIRVSFHIYNSADDVDRLLEVVGRLVRRSR
jgi:selenocysteine lyase/cysteine desulfurase